MISDHAQPAPPIATATATATAQRHDRLPRAPRSWRALLGPVVAMGVRDLPRRRQRPRRTRWPPLRAGRRRRAGGASWRRAALEGHRTEALGRDQLRVRCAAALA